MFQNRHYVHAANHLAGIDTALSVLPEKQRQHTAAVISTGQTVEAFKNYPAPDDNYQLAAIIAETPAAELEAKVKELAVIQRERELVKGALQAGGLAQTEGRLEQALIASQDEYAARLQTTAAKVCADITRAAAGIPSDKALDPAAAIAGDFVDQHRTILDGLATLTKLSGVFNPVRPKEATKGIGVGMLAVIPTTTVTVRARMHEATINPKQEQEVNEGVKQLLKDYDEKPTQTLVNIAADTYPGVTLGIPTSTADLKERRDRLYMATLMRRANDTTDNRMLVM